MSENSDIVITVPEVELTDEDIVDNELEDKRQKARTGSTAQNVQTLLETLQSSVADEDAPSRIVHEGMLSTKHFPYTEAEDFHFILREDSLQWFRYLTNDSDQHQTDANDANNTDKSAKQEDEDEDVEMEFVDSYSLQQLRVSIYCGNALKKKKKKKKKGKGKAEIAEFSFVVSKRHGDTMLLECESEDDLVAWIDQLTSMESQGVQFIPMVSEVFTNPDRSGYLSKHTSKSRKTAEKLWMVLKGTDLFYFNEKGDDVPRGFIPLLECYIYIPEVTSSTKNPYFSVVLKDTQKTITLSAPSRKEFFKWKDAVMENTKKAVFERSKKKAMEETVSQNKGKSGSSALSHSNHGGATTPTVVEGDKSSFVSVKFFNRSDRRSLSVANLDEYARVIGERNSLSVDRAQVRRSMTIDSDSDSEGHVSFDGRGGDDFEADDEIGIQTDDSGLTTVNLGNGIVAKGYRRATASKYSDVDSMRSVISESFEHMLRLSTDLPRRKRTEVMDSLEGLPAKLDEMDGDLVSDSTDNEVGYADEFMLPFILALETSNIEMAMVAVDGLTNLLMGEHIAGRRTMNELGLGDGRNDGELTLCEVLIRSLCSCATMKTPAVRNALAKVFHAAVRSRNCQVHGNSLRRILIACFTLYDQGQSAKVSIPVESSMTRIIVWLMDNFEIHVHDQVDNAESSPSSSSSSSALSSSAIETTFTDGDVGEMLVETLTMDEVVENTHLESLRTHIPTEVSPSESPRDSSIGEDQDLVLETEQTEQTEQTDEVSKEASDDGDAIKQSEETVQLDDEEEEDDEDDQEPQIDLLKGLLNVVYRNESHRDCIWMLNTLCDLLIDNTEMDGQELVFSLKEKTYCLNFMVTVMNNAGPAFIDDEIVVELVQTKLVPALLQLFFSTNTKTCVSVFAGIFQHFRSCLTLEVESMFQGIFFKFLSVHTETIYNDNLSILRELFQPICSSGQMLVDVFANCDMVMEKPNICMRLVEQLSETARTVPTEGGPSPPLNEVALDCIVDLLQSLITWWTENKESMDDDESGVDVRQMGGLSALLLGTEAYRNKFVSDLFEDFDPTMFDKHTDDDEQQEEGPESKKANESTKTDVDVEQSSQDSYIPDTIPVSFTSMMQQKNLVQEAVALFNSRGWKRGIPFIQKRVLKTEDPLQMAVFLRFAHDISKVEKGEFLSRNKPFNKAVMRAYSWTFDFSGFDLDEAMRVFLGTFNIVGEAQVIDRTLEPFANKFHLDNPTMFGCADTAFIMSFALMMLNTDLHNPSVEEKMTFEQFTTNNRGIDNGQDVTLDVQRRLYDNIRDSALKFDQKMTAEEKLNLRSMGSQLLEETAESLRNLKWNRYPHNRQFSTCSDAHIVLHIWEKIWPSIFATLSDVLDSGTTDVELVMTTVNAFLDSLHLCYICQTPIAVNVFITALAKHRSCEASGLGQRLTSGMKSFFGGSAENDEWANQLTELLTDYDNTSLQQVVAELNASVVAVEFLDSVSSKKK